MSQDQTNLLQLLRLPARLTVVEAAWLLGVNAGDIPILMAAKLLKPLGHPPQNGQKSLRLVNWNACATIPNGWPRHPMHSCGIGGGEI